METLCLIHLAPISYGSSRHPSLSKFRLLVQFASSHSKTQQVCAKEKLSSKSQSTWTYIYKRKQGGGKKLPKTVIFPTMQPLLSWHTNYATEHWYCGENEVLGLLLYIRRNLEETKESITLAKKYLSIW